MARRAKKTNVERLSNGFDGAQVERFIEKIEAYHSDLASEKGSYMARCRQVRDSINVVYVEADALGISRKVLKAHVSLRQKEAEKQRIIERLNDSEAEDFTAVADALGDFAAMPLGAAAVARARSASSEDRDALNSLN